MNRPDGSVVNQSPVVEDIEDVMLSAKTPVGHSIR
jgi:hypothetical protein